MKPTDLYLVWMMLVALCPSSLAAPASIGSLAMSAPLDASPRFADIIANAGHNKTFPYPHNTTLLSFRPWPWRYYIPLPYSYGLQLTVRAFAGPDPPAISLLQHFINDFADNIKSTNPPPGLSPQKAYQDYFDTDSFTKYQIFTDVDGLFASRAPSWILINALSKLVVELRRHGPPGQLSGLIIQSRKGRLPPRLFNSISFDIMPIGSMSLKGDHSNSSVVARV